MFTNDFQIASTGVLVSP